MKQVEEKLGFIRIYDPEGADKLKRLLDRKDALKAGNVYGERFTDRQFSLVFDPILALTFDKARVLEAVGGGEGTVKGLAAKLGLKEDMVFRHIKELMKRNFIEIAGHEGRYAVFGRKA
jgi:DNA-binding MarR family transcriptional regulator